MEIDRPPGKYPKSMITPNKKGNLLGHVISCRQWIELLDELNIGAFTVGSDRGIISMNHCALALIGLREAEAVGRDCREIFTGIPCMVNCVLRGKPHGEFAEPDVDIPESRGKYLLTREATPIYDENGNISGCLTILQDHSPIADLIDRINHEERSMRMILDSLDVGILTINRGGHITFFNREAEKISGYGRRDVLGKPYSAIFEGEAADIPAMLRESVQKGTLSRRGGMRSKAGETLPIRANHMALKNEKGVVIGGLATFHDLTLLRQFNQAMRDRYRFDDMIGKSPEMLDIFDKAGVVAKTDATVLIEGPTGTGKDLLAKVIHSSGGRAARPFVKVNCAAIPENLLESEMFGYAKGAFTGAGKDKPGRFNEADGGTIFLDEIGDLPLSLQAKLLRVIEDREFYPLGSRRTVKVDVRIISATNRCLEKLVGKRLFREDLYYRLNLFRFELPPLRQRRNDIPLLAGHILRRQCAALDRRAGISGSAMEILLKQDYPGNIRELENILEYALIICPDDTILPKHLPDHVQNRRETSSTLAATNDPARVETRMILDMLERHGGNRTKAAKALGIDRSTLWRKMKRFGIL